jgi:hypothetical protein
VREYAVRDYAVREYAVREYAMRDYAVRYYAVRDYAVRDYDKEGRQCRYNVMLRSVRVTIVALAKQYYLCRESLCSLITQHAE